MNEISVIINNKEVKCQEGISLYQLSKNVDIKNGNKILAAKVNNQLVSLNTKCHDNMKINFIDVCDSSGFKMYQSALKFIFIEAVKEVLPGAEVIYEHSVPKGILAKVDKVLIENVDISKIKGKMASLIAEDIHFEKLNIYKGDAIKYFERTNEYEKAKNIYNKSYDIVNLYKLKNSLNYFYSELPYSTGAITKFEIKYLGDNYFVLVLPSARNNGNIPEYVHYQNIVDSFFDGSEWLKKVGVPYLSDLNTLIATGKIKEFIDACELTFNDRIHECAKKIMEKTGVKLVLIAGPSSSGKTTSTKRLASYLKAHGYDAIQISVDDYFVNKDKTPKDENGEYDFECLRAIKLEELNNDLNTLINGGEVTLPVYDFEMGIGKRVGKTIKMKENSIILIEGLHSLNDEMTPYIEPRYKYKIYLSPFIPLNIDPHNYISTIDLRLIRRIVRDYRTRARSVTETIESWQSVRDGEEKYIFPYIHQANIIVNTALPYELNIMKVFVEPLLYEVTYDSKYYEEARRLLDSLRRFYPVTSEYVSGDSILREFIGWKGDFND